MTTRTLHPLAEAYLDRLERAADHLPRARRKELVDEIEGHLAEALGPEPTEAEVLTALDRLGEPEEIAEAEQPRPGPRRAGADGSEWAAIVLLLIGGFFVGVGWIVGVVLLWRSRVWTLRDKLIGTLLWPGGLLTALTFAASYLLSDAACTPGCRDNGTDLTFIPVLVALVVPVATAIYLARRAKQSSSS